VIILFIVENKLEVRCPKEERAGSPKTEVGSKKGKWFINILSFYFPASAFGLPSST